VVVIAVEEAPLLFAVHRIVGGIEVQDQLLGWPAERGDEPVDQHGVQLPGRLPVGTVLPPAQGRGTGQIRVAAHGRLDRQVAAQAGMIVEVLIAQGQGVDPLAQQTQGIVVAAGLAARIDQRAGHGFGQAEATIGLLQQQHAAVGGDVATLEIGFYLTALTGWKSKRFLGTVCHGQNLSVFWSKQLNYNGFIKVLPFYL
jgi:hypothetical protein